MGRRKIISSTEWSGRSAWHGVKHVRSGGDTVDLVGRDVLPLQLPGMRPFGSEKQYFAMSPAACTRPALVLVLDAMLDVFSRTISRRSYDQLGALKPLFGVACPLWWGKESPCSSTSSRSAPDGRLVTRRQPNSAPDRGHLMACKRTWQVTRPVAPHVSRPIPLGFRARSHWPKRRSSP
jgi:hypothetical protein